MTYLYLLGTSLLAFPALSALIGPFLLLHESVVLHASCSEIIVDCSIDVFLEDRRDIDPTWAGHAVAALRTRDWYKAAVLFLHPFDEI